VVRSSVLKLKRSPSFSRAAAVVTRFLAEADDLDRDVALPEQLVLEDRVDVRRQVGPGAGGMEER